MKVVFWNTAGNGNLGDELCYRGAIEYCRKKYPVTTIKQIISLNNRTIDWVKNADLLMIGGGQLIDKSNILHKLKHWFDRIDVKTAVEFAGVGIGSSDDIRKYRQFLVEIEAEWHVRDLTSLSILKENGLEKFIANRLPEDLSFCLDLKSKRASGLAKVGVNLKNVYKDKFQVRATADILAGWVDPIVLIPFNSEPRHATNYHGEVIEVSDCNDLALAKQISDEVQSENMAINAFNLNQDPIKYSESISECGYMITERFHAAVLAYRFGIPFRAISYHNKVERFMRMVGLEDNIIGPTADDIEKALTDLREEARDISFNEVEEA